MDFSTFESLSDVQPDRVIARHPDGVYIAMATDSAPPAIGVWDTTTGQAVWTVEDVLALAWNTDGSQLALVRSAVSANHPPTANRERYIFERRLWPEDATQSVCTFEFALPWNPWPCGIWMAPKGRLAIVRWADQGGSGWEPIIILDTGDRHLAGAGFRLDSEVATEMCPGISSDGRYAASGYQTKCVATANGHEEPRIRGRFECGGVTVIDLYSGAFHEIIIDDAVPVKLHGTASRWTDTPIFISEHEFTVILPTGSKRIFRVH